MVLRLVRCSDRYIIAFAKSSEYGLIKNAALSAFEEIKETVKGRNNLILAGSGNNGADGIALHGILKKNGIKSKVFYLGKGKSAENIELRKEVDEEDVSGSIVGFDSYIDAVFGSSFHPPLGGKVKDILSRGHV